MQRLLKVQGFYGRYLEPNDPYGIHAKRSLKVVLTLMVVVWASSHWSPQTMMISALMVFFTVLSLTGDTLKVRKINTLIFIGLVMVLSPAMAMVSDIPVLRITLAGMLSFLGLSLGLAGASAQVMGLILVVSVLAFSQHGVVPVDIPRMMLSILVPGLLTYVALYLFFPMRPRVILLTAYEKLVARLAELTRLALDKDRDAEFQEAADRMKTQLQAFDKFPGILNYLPERKDGPKTALFYLISLFRQMLMEIRAVQRRYHALETASLPPGLQKKLEDLSQRLIDLMNHWETDLLHIDYSTDIKPLVDQARRLQQQLLDHPVKVTGEEQSIGNAGGLFELLYHMYTLAEELSETMEETNLLRQLKESGSLPDQRAKLQRYRQGFRLDNLYFRYILQATAAVVVTMSLALARHMEHGLWVVIFTLVLIKPSEGSSMKSSLIRLLGTAIGVAIAVVIWKLGGHEALWVLLILSALAYFYLSKMPYQLVNTSIVTVGMISMYMILYPEVTNIGWVRLGDTVLAVGIGVAISRFLWPNRARIQLKDKVPELRSLIGDYFQKTCAATNEDGIKQASMAGAQVAQALQSTRDLFDQAMMETLNQLKNKERLLALMKTIDAMNRITNRMLHYRIRFTDNHLQKEVSAPLTAFGKVVEQILATPGSQLNRKQALDELERNWAPIEHYVHSLETKGLAGDELANFLGYCYHAREAKETVKESVQAMEELNGLANGDLGITEVDGPG